MQKLISSLVEEKGIDHIILTATKGSRAPLIKFAKVNREQVEVIECSKKSLRILDQPSGQITHIQRISNKQFVKLQKAMRRAARGHDFGILSATLNVGGYTALILKPVSTEDAIRCINVAFPNTPKQGFDNGTRND